ncbi:ferredoxin-NADP reductase [Flammeovirga sp. SJP92]|uniref:ferredoxin-NADP reductase n=1 Tax=Flammeovirga sp. SJP92 TaxID=1775430 RepID=UPI0007881494|nr:ferredoxin-NADP reductase [Flammeovirga sp. SJP92]KXX66580.1 ferredoxin-NADP reductase [Flammeovirga sp. SJP92]
MSSLADYKTETTYKAKVILSIRVSPSKSEEVREIILEVEDPTFECKVNQSFGVLVEKEGDFGQKYHHRLYSVSDIPVRVNGKTRITLLVKRCNYVDAFNGEQYKGVSSNFLCSRKVLDEVIITGPFDLAFQLPKDKSANMILIGMGTGIAPFRAFVKHIYENVKDWKGAVRLFYGAKSGLEMLYMNEQNDDLTQYYDQATFKAFQAVTSHGQWSDTITLDATIESKAEEVLKLLNQNNTYIYVAGHEKIKENLDKAFAKILGSEEAWLVRKAELIAGQKWAEVIY